ncbi:hypothetical protein MH117_05105 [Paenibacillus sp. ACRRX]|uniref:hypothetical protein n=1 Tax=Paenibacillus sp. ACRRX TaxID=2918206 RepID=UPI001EF4A567|nr:hypothetical protein [Paenibacillus sp. ACRRX]MCG7406789.1 hypothetical protein [Paenibacillus sp. ACRRX]
MEFKTWTPTGYYNYQDLNRIEANTKEIAEALLKWGYPTEMQGHIINRDSRRIEFADSLNRLESNIAALAAAIYVPTGWEPPKTTWAAGHKFDYKDANRLERNLERLDTLTNATIGSLIYCGTFSCGEEVI